MPPKLKDRKKQFKLYDFHTEDVKVTVKKQIAPKKWINVENTVFQISMFGLNEIGQECCIIVTDMKPFFYVKIPNEWEKGQLVAFTNMLCKEIKKENGYIQSVFVHGHQPLHGFVHDEKHTFAQLTFPNMFSFNKAKRLWITRDFDTNSTIVRPVIFNKANIRIYESNLLPLLRYLHMTEISPSGWIEFDTSDVEKVEERRTNCNFEYKCSMKHIIPLPNKETSVPLIIASFDIECSSSHGDFPVPIKDYRKLATQLIDVFTSRLATDNLSTSLTSKTNLDKSRKLLDQIVKQAFSFGSSIPTIDCVYPKVPVTKENVLKLISLLHKPFDIGPKGDNVVESERIISIHSMFEQMSILENHENDNDDNENDNENGNDAKKKCRSIKIPKGREETIYNVILSPTLSREDKIVAVNTHLTTILPALEGDKVTFIGTTFRIEGQRESYKRHCFCHTTTCAPVPGSIIETAVDERSMLIGWQQLIKRERPHIYSGYNICGFDWEFMFRRAQETNCVNEWSQLSKFVGESSLVTKYNESFSELVKSSAKFASGECNLHYPNSPGILQIDLLHYFKRNCNYSSYKLDDVAGYNIYDAISDVVCHDGNQEKEKEKNGITQLRTKNLVGLHIGDYISINIINKTTTTTLFSPEGRSVSEKKAKFEVLDMVDADNGYKYIIIPGQYPELGQHKKLNWCIAKDDVSPQEIFKLANGTAEQRSTVAKYCMNDCDIPQSLMYKTDIVTEYSEMAFICSTPMHIIITRGQSIKLQSYVAKICRENKKLMADLEPDKNASKYEGAIVLTPKPAAYTDTTVACNDYASLYPSAAKGYDISPDTKVWTKNYDLLGNLVSQTGECDAAGNFKFDNLPGVRYINTEFDLFYEHKHKRIVTGKRVCRWAQTENAIMPLIIGRLLQARKDTRKKQKEEKDPFMKNVYEKRQLGYKVTNNSIYGQTGSPVSSFAEQDVAASITSIGRKMIYYAKHIAEEIWRDRIYYVAKYDCTVHTECAYVYGDTDSVFFTFNLKELDGTPIVGMRSIELTCELATETARLASLFLPAPMSLTFEKSIDNFILLSKKRYAGDYYELNELGQVFFKGFKYMGLQMKKRDSCACLTDIYATVLQYISNYPIDRAVEMIINYLTETLNCLVDGQIPIDKLAITKSLGSGYANPNSIPHNVLANRIEARAPGTRPKSGDRMAYVFIVHKKPANAKNYKKLLGNCIETIPFILENKIAIDYTYYITNMIMNPLLQLLGLIIPAIHRYLQTSATYIQNYDKMVKSIMTPDVIATWEINGDVALKKLQKYQAETVQELIFTPFLNKLHNKMNGIRTLDMFFAKCS